MTITLDITSKLHAELTRQAAAHGSAVEAYATALLEEALCLPEAVFDRARRRLQRVSANCARASHSTA